MTIQTALSQGTDLLERAAVPSPRLTAEVLLSHALRCERIFLFSHPEEELSETAWIHYGRYLHQRMEGRPTQYITKKQEFYAREFRVTPAVLIPRPETEIVVEHAIERLRQMGGQAKRPGRPRSDDTAATGGGDAQAEEPGPRRDENGQPKPPVPLRVVDVGCGSGAIATTIALETRAEVLGTDISMDALEVARENAERLGARVRFVNMDLLSSFGNLSADAVVSNPPYVSHAEADGLQREVRDFEPHVALFAGERGTEIYERIAADAQRVLRPGGLLVFELGWKSLEPVRTMLARVDRWSDIEVADDLAGIPRALSARWHP